VYAFTTYGQLTSIGNVLPFAQAVHETACFLSPRWIGSFNPAGLGATNDGAWGKTFATPAAGILAQYAHLLSYALADGHGTFAQQRLSMYFDPRRAAMGNTRGCALTWRGLNGRWAVPGTTYAEKIIEIANAIVTSGGL